MRLDIFENFDDQALVCFTGKLNLLEKSNNSFVGEIVFLDGEIINARHSNVEGFKALMSLCSLSTVEGKYRIVVEPELITKTQQKIEVPLGKLKRKISEYIEQYQSSQKLKPPANMKLLARAEVIESNIEITAQEYSLLCTLSDYNLVEDVYNNNEMLDFEITQALVSLRKKEVIKVIKLV